MNRFRTSLLALIVMPTAAFCAEPNVVMLPGTTVPAYSGASIPAMLTQPIPVDPNVHFPGACAADCAPRAGVLKSMMNWMCQPKTACAPNVSIPNTCNVTANYKPVVAVAKVPREKATIVHTSGKLDRFKEWFCWHPSKEQGIPVFLASPYQSPLRAYFRNCTEPAMGCATGCAASKCESTGTVGPVEKATVVQQVGMSGQTLLPGFRFAKATATPGQVAFAKLAPATVTPVGYVAPIGPVAPKPNPLVRPFTNP